MSLLTVRVFSSQQAAEQAKSELEVAGFTVTGPKQAAPVAWDASQAGGGTDSVAQGWVIVAEN